MPVLSQGNDLTGEGELIFKCIVFPLKLGIFQLLFAHAEHADAKSVVPIERYRLLVVGIHVEPHLFAPPAVFEHRIEERRSYARTAMTALNEELTEKEVLFLLTVQTICNRSVTARDGQYSLQSPV